LRIAEAAFVALAAMLLIEALTGGALRAFLPPPDFSPDRIKDMTSLGRGETALATIVFAGLYLMARRGRAIVLLALLFFAVALAAARLPITTNVIILAAGSAVFAFSARWPRAGVAGVAAIIVAFLAFAPLARFLPVETLFAHGEGAPASWLQRLLIWKTTARAAIDCLPFGCGAEAARTIGATAGTANVPGWAQPLPVLPIHPHNVFLEIWLELGIPGVIFFAGAIVNGAGAILKAELPAGARAVVAATAAGLVASASLEWSLWQVWRLGAVVLVALYLALALKASPVSASKARI
jgi:O-antigen ligase